MSSEIHKYIEKSLEREDNFLNAELIDFPNHKRAEILKNLSVKHQNTWKLYDKSNEGEDGDQLKAVIGICFIIGVLIITGLYSNLI